MAADRQDLTVSVDGLARTIYSDGNHITGAELVSQSTGRQHVYRMGECFLLVLEGEDGVDVTVGSSDLEIDRITSLDGAGPAGRGVRITFAPFGISGRKTGGASLLMTYETRRIDSPSSLESSLTLRLTGARTGLKLRHLYMDLVDCPREDLLFTPPLEFTVPESTDSLPPEQVQLGQPVYLKGLILGSRFPANKNAAVDKGDKTRVLLDYRTAMPLEDCRNEPWQSWPAVAAPSRGADMEALQEDFRDYLGGIARTPSLRIQYNSWYDHFLGVDAGRFRETCLMMDQAVRRYGMPPLDAYVLDDGWNNYNDPEFTGIDREASGPTPNRSGFWEFNDKFPSGIGALHQTMEEDGMPLGLWLGPQGGYVHEGTFAQFLESRGRGHVNHEASVGRALDVNDRHYLELLKDFLLETQKEGHLVYWKFDGFASHPCREEGHGHYLEPDAYTTQLWERWIDIFRALREENPDIFINATTYAPVSPWLLAWVDTIWVQNSDDREQARDAAGDATDQVITGRDRVYYRNVFQARLQLPLTYYYNHEPIYGHADETPYTDEGFTRYLLVNALRGPMLWELHLSPDRLTQGQWRGLAGVLNFVRAHFETLQESRMYTCGGDLNSGYGYSAQKADDHFLLVRNPTADPIRVHLPQQVRDGLMTTIYPADGGQVDTETVIDLPPLACLLLSKREVDLRL